jgi:hypothetical protein
VGSGACFFGGFAIVAGTAQPPIMRVSVSACMRIGCTLRFRGSFTAAVRPAQNRTGPSEHKPPIDAHTRECTPMRKFIAYALVGLALIAGTAVAVMPTAHAAPAGCNSADTDC